MPKRAATRRPPRNTAPGWKKAAIVLSAPVAVVILSRIVDLTSLNVFVLLVVMLAVIAVAVWGTSKLLGVHIGLRSWD
jgi:hypothetical protein